MILPWRGSQSGPVSAFSHRTVSSLARSLPASRAAAQACCGGSSGVFGGTTSRSAIRSRSTDAVGTAGLERSLGTCSRISSAACFTGTWTTMGAEARRRSGSRGTPAFAAIIESFQGHHGKRGWSGLWKRRWTIYVLAMVGHPLRMYEPEETSARFPRVECGRPFSGPPRWPERDGSSQRNLTHASILSGPSIACSSRVPCVWGRPASPSAWETK